MKPRGSNDVAAAIDQLSRSVEKLGWNGARSEMGAIENLAFEISQLRKTIVAESEALREALEEARPALKAVRK